jgi:hypothetical protein
MTTPTDARAGSRGCFMSDLTSVGEGTSDNMGDVRRAGYFQAIEAGQGARDEGELSRTGGEFVATEQHTTAFARLEQVGQDHGRASCEGRARRRAPGK